MTLIRPIVVKFTSYKTQEASMEGQWRSTPCSARQNT